MFQLWAAGLLFCGMLSGIPLALANTGKISANPQYMLAAHLNAILGALIIFAYSLSLRSLRYTRRWVSNTGMLVVVSNYANFILTFTKALLHVRGLEFTGNSTNDTLFLLLNIFVVLPAIGGVGLWFAGFRSSTGESGR